MPDCKETNGRYDVRIWRIVTLSLGGTVIITALAISVLAACGAEVPPSLPTFGSTALGALTGMLANLLMNKNPG